MLKGKKDGKVVLVEKDNGDIVIKEDALLEKTLKEHQEKPEELQKKFDKVTDKKDRDDESDINEDNAED